MAETAQKKITLNNFFEQIVEINKVSQKALKKSDESLSVSEKTKIDLERLIQLLKVDFTKEVEKSKSESGKEITNIIREDATEDRELKDSFLELQSSFRDLSSAIGIMRKDLDSLSSAFLQMQQGRRKALKQQGREISKEEDTLQKEQILGTKDKGGDTRQVQDQKRQQEQKENKALSALKGLLGGGLLTGLGAVFGGGGDGTPTDVPSAGDLSGDQKEAENKTFDYLSKNYGKNVAYGMLSNAMRESGYRTETGGEFYGMFQWDENRKQRLLDYAKSKGKSPTDRDIQVEFAVIEAKESGTLGRMQSATTPEQASSIFYNEFERAAYSKPVVGEKNYDPNNPHEKKNTEYLIQIKKRQEQREQILQQHREIRSNLEKDHPADKGRSKEEADQIRERHRQLREQSLSPQSFVLPQQRSGVPELTKPMSQSVASVTLPPIEGQTQQIGGGQGRGQASTNSYGVKSTTNSMMFAQVLSGGFSDKMNIAVG